MADQFKTQEEFDQFSKLSSTLMDSLSTSSFKNKEANDLRDQIIASTKDLIGDSQFSVETKGTIDVDDLDSSDTLDSLKSRISTLGGEVNELSGPTDKELKLSNQIMKDDLRTKEAQKDLFGRGTGVPLSLLQGKERKLAEQRSFDRMFDQLELDLLESSRTRELKVRQGELDSASAEAEQFKEITEANTDLLDRLVRINSGATLEEIAQSNPETFARIQSAVANSNYSLGDVRQALTKGAEGTKKSLQFRNVNGKLVGIDPLSGKVVTTVGTAGSPKATGTQSGDSEFTTVLNLVPNMSNENAQSMARILEGDGADQAVIRTIAEKYPKAFSSNRVTRVDLEQAKEDMKSDLEATFKGSVGQFFSGGKLTDETQAEIDYWSGIIGSGIISYDGGKEVEFLTQEDRQTLASHLQSLTN